MKTGWLVAIAAIVMTGCSMNSGPEVQTGPAEHETRSVEKGKADSVRVELKMGAGELKVNGGAVHLMDANFTYNVPDWKPRVEYTDSGVRGTLTVEQPGEVHHTVGNSKNSWDLNLNNDIPVSLTVKFGAGEGELDLGKLNLQSLDVEIGVGTLRVDLRGSPKQDYHVDIKGGVGEARVYLPHDAGVVATVNGGLGSIEATGLQKEGNRYVNAAYASNPKVTVRVDVQGGIGAVHLIGD